MAVELDKMTDDELTKYMDGILNDPDFDESDNEDVKVTDEGSNEEAESEDAGTNELDEDNSEDSEDNLEQSEDQIDDEGTNDSEVDTDDNDANNEEDDADAEDDPEDVENDSEESDGSDDEEFTGDEGQSDEADVEAEEAISEPQVYTIKANGTDVEATLEELLALAPKALNYTKKMQDNAKYNKMISAIKEENISQEEINLAIDMLKGDKDAILSVIQKHKIDLVELDTDDSAKYTPNNYGKTDTELAIEEIDSQIRLDPEYKITKHVIGTQWDDASRDFLMKTPQAINILHNNIKSGDFDKINSMAIKMKALDGGLRSDLDYYTSAGDNYYAKIDAKAKSDALEVTVKAEREAEASKVAKARAERAKLEATKAQAKKRKAATPTKRTTGKAGKVDYMAKNVSDEAFSDMMDKLLGD